MYLAGGSDNYARPLICNVNNNMASWFSGGALGETFNGLKDKVQSKVNNIDPDLIKKLTLQSDELVSERQRIDEEERRKENVRDSLAEIFPWETRDAEMEILVDECKEVSFSHLLYNTVNILYMPTNIQCNMERNTHIPSFR